MQTRSQYNANENSKAADNSAGHSFARAGLLFGSLALALGLVLVPVYLKHSSNRLIDSQYAAPQSSVAK